MLCKNVEHDEVRVDHGWDQHERAGRGKIYDLVQDSSEHQEYKKVIPNRD